MPDFSELAAGYRCRLLVLLAVFFLILVNASPVAYAHTDLQLQIEALTAQLESEPGNVDLLLRRGDLQRRHKNPDLARADFERVREIQPDNKTVDWFEGRLEVESGQAAVGVQLLDRFLLYNPGHQIALQNRAQGYLLLNQPLLAAQDFNTVIEVSDKPTPSLFSAHALALVAAGEDHFRAAMDVVKLGLKRFPSEISLTGIGTDVSLAQSDTDTARILIDQLPPSIQKLPQWQTRKALLDCQTGNDVRAMQWFSAPAAVSSKTNHTHILFNEEWLDRLASDPTPSNCQAAALWILQSH